MLEVCYDWSIIILPNDITGYLELSVPLRDNSMVMLILQITVLENFFNVAHGTIHIQLKGL